jgi:hypothetical protein
VSGPRRQPWDRLDGETPKQFAAFSAYLHLPRADRSVLAAYRASSGRTEAENLKPPGCWYDWYERHRWDERSRSFDAADDRKREERLRTRRLKELEATADLGRKLQDAADLGRKLLSPIPRTMTTPDGEVVIPGWRPTAADVARLAEVGTKLALLGLGLPDSRTSFVDGGADEAAEMLAGIKDDLRRRLDAIRDRQRQADQVVSEEMTFLLQNLRGNGGGGGA